MTNFNHWQEWIARIFRTDRRRDRRRHRARGGLDLNTAVEIFESRELLSASGMMGAFDHARFGGGADYGSTGGWGGPSRGADFQFNANHGGSHTWQGGDAQSTQGTQLVFTVEPTNGTAGQSFSVTVSVEDSSGNILTGNDANVTLRVADGPGDFSGSRTLTATAVNGVAIFNNVVLDKAGTYTLVTHSQGAGRSFSSSFTIAPDTTDPGQLVFLPGSGSQTSSSRGDCGDGGSNGDGSWFGFRRHSHAIRGTAGQPLSTFRVAEEDKFGNVITSDSTSTITVAVNTGPTSAVVDSKSTLTATVQDGVATFDNVILDTAGQYTLSATDSNSSYPTAISGSIRVRAESDS
jgi:hypothetical protein